VYSRAPTQYNLHVQVTGSGTTNATTNALYAAGAAVSVAAQQTLVGFSVIGSSTTVMLALPIHTPSQ